MHEIRCFAWPMAVLALTGVSLATPPKPEIEGDRPGVGVVTTGKQDPVGPDRSAEMNAMALRGGVPQDVWFEGLHRLTRVSSPRREEITRAVRRYQVEIAAWQATKVPELKDLSKQVGAARAAEEPIPREVSDRIREIRRSRPMLPDLQRTVWGVLTGPEQARLADELSELKRKGLPQDVRDGRRPAGSPARITSKKDASPADPGDGAPKPAETETPPPLLWSFVDDPNAGRPLSDSKEITPSAKPEVAD